MAATLNYNGASIASGMVAQRAKFDRLAEVSKTTHSSSTHCSYCL